MHVSVATRVKPDLGGWPHARVLQERLEPRCLPALPAWAVAIGLAIVLGLFSVRCLLVTRSTSITSDESTYLTHGIHYWLTGNDLRMWELGTPRLPHLINSWASYEALRQAGLLAKLDPEPRLGVTKLVLSGTPRALRPARYLAIGWGLLLLAAVYWGCARMRGAGFGLLAVALLSMVPEVLAHTSLAASDMPFAATSALALVLLARYAERPSAGRWWCVALLVGLAWATRHTGVLLVGLASAINLWCGLRRPRAAGIWPVVERVCGSAWSSAGLALLAYCVLWAGDGFGTVTCAEASASITRLNLPERVGRFDVSGFPIPTSALSVLKQISHQARGHEAYFCGQLSQQGWLLYFPVAFLLKTPLGLVGLLVLAAARVRARLAWEWICLGCLALLWASLIHSKVNIGVRYALLTYPLAMPLVARLFEPALLRDRVWGPLALGLAVWFAGASVACHPRYLSYFNEVGGGPKRGWLYLADSNLDWGQDFDALAARLKRLGINDVTTDISSDRRLMEPGLYALPNPSRELQVRIETPPNRRLYDSEGAYTPIFTRYVATSASRLLGLYSHNDMSWLRTRKLVCRVGDSIFVFDIDQPAHRAFAP